MKTVVLLHSPDPAFVEGLPALLRHRPWATEASRIVVHLPLPSVPASEEESACAPCDAVIEIWSSEAVHPFIATDAALAGAWLDIRGSEEIIGKAGEGMPPPGVTPGLSQLSFIEAIADLPRSEVERHWSEHIPLADAIHIGMNRYVQDRFSPAESANARWFGMAHLHFPDERALTEGLFRRPEDIALITTDVAEFVAEHATMTVIEHVVKG